MTAATVSVKVLDELGYPVAGASVYFVRAPVNMPDVAMRTDADGLFLLGVRCAGVYRIGVTAQGYPSLEHDVPVSAGKSTLLTLRWGKKNN